MDIARLIIPIDIAERAGERDDGKVCKLCGYVVDEGARVHREIDGNLTHFICWQTENTEFEPLEEEDPNA